MCCLLQLLLSPDWFPLNRPGVQEYLNILYNFTVPLLLLKVTDTTQLWKISGRWVASTSPHRHPQLPRPLPDARTEPEDAGAATHCPPPRPYRCGHGQQPPPGGRFSHAPPTAA